MLPVALAPPKFACVVAIDAAHGIGRGNALPWPRLPGDVAHFRDLTTATRDAGARNAVIMGRLTWDSVPPKFRPLPRRLNVVVSRAALPLPDGVRGATSLDAAIEAATAAGVETVHVVGGGQIYALAIADPRCELLYVTRLDARYDCDAFFPRFEDGFAREASDPPRTEAGVTYVIERWRRRPA